MPDEPERVRNMEYRLEQSSQLPLIHIARDLCDLFVQGPGSRWVVFIIIDSEELSDLHPGSLLEVSE
jgi:hypothetical protein